jgi:hypothetical protein
LPQHCLTYFVHSMAFISRTIRMAGDLLETLDATAEHITLPPGAKADAGNVLPLSVSHKHGEAPSGTSSPPSTGGSEGGTEVLNDLLSRSRARELLLEAQIRQLYEELADTRRREERRRDEWRDEEERTEELLRVKKEYAALQVKYGALLAEYDGHRASSSVALSAARVESRGGERRLEEMREEMASLRVAYQRREETLSNEIADLSAALATAQRSLDNRIPPSDMVDGDQERAEERIRREVTAGVEMAVMQERMTVQRLRTETQSLTKQLDVSRVSCEDMRRKLAELVVEKESREASLSARVDTLTRQLEEQTAEGNKARADELASRLAVKVGALARASSEVAAMRQALNEEKAAHATTREALANAASAAAKATPEALSDDGSVSELEDAPLQLQTRFLTDTNTAVVPRLTAKHTVTDGYTRHTTGKVSERLTPLKRMGGLVNKHRHVADAADLLDRFCLLSTRHMLRHPVLRLVALVYLLLLHIWVFFLVSFHTHALPHDSHATGGFMPPKPR